MKTFNELSENKRGKDFNKELKESPVKFSAIELGRELERSRFFNDLKMEPGEPKKFKVKKDFEITGNKIKKGTILIITRSKTSNGFDVHKQNSLNPKDFDKLITTKTIKKKVFQ